MAVLLAVAAVATSSAQADAQAAQGVIVVTKDNFARAESDRHLAQLAQGGALGRFMHSRNVPPIEGGVSVRSERDILYSHAAFDLAAGPVEITLPDPGTRFMSLLVVDEDHYTHGVFYGAGKHSLARDAIGTRYAVAIVRTQVNVDDPIDLRQAHALQDAVAVAQRGGPGRLDLPVWDRSSQDKVRDALLASSATLPDLRRMFGPKELVDPDRHVIGAAFAWGSVPDSDAVYIRAKPTGDNSQSVYALTMKSKTPVAAFWSVTLYNAYGYFRRNPLNAYSFNNATVKKDADGAVTVQFGGCDGGTINCLPTVPDWNYMVRLYRPQPAVLDGTWAVPAPQEIRLLSKAR